MRTCKQWRLHCASQWGQLMPLSEHVYCVALKMTEQVKQRICIKFCIKLEHCSTETIWMIHKDIAMGNWWLATLSQQCACSFTILYRDFCETSNRPGDSAPYSPDLGPCCFWLFPKLKSPLKDNRFQTVNEIQENTSGQLIAIARTVWGPKVPALKGTEASLSCVQCFLYLVSSSVNVTNFHITWLGTFWTDLIVFPKWDTQFITAKWNYISRVF